MVPDARRALEDAEDLVLVTTGRTSGKPHAVTLPFAYADGMVWLRTDERPPAPDASGVRMRTRRERDPDWLRNLEQEPRCELRVGGVAVPAVYERSTDVVADLRRAVELLRAKYGSGWVEDWYVDRGRVPVKLRVA